jgi:hypothetical protein
MNCAKCKNKIKNISHQNNDDNNKNNINIPNQNDTNLYQDKVITLNPITEYSPPLILDPITIDLTNNEDAKKFIKNLSIPFWANCIINNKYVKVRTNEIIILEFPKYLLGQDFVFDSNISKKIKKIICYIKKTHPKMTDFEIKLYLTFIKKKYPELINNYMKEKSDNSTNSTNSTDSTDSTDSTNSTDKKKQHFNILSLNKAFDFFLKKESCKDHLFEKIIKVIECCKFKPKNVMETITIKKNGITLINKANYSISMGKFFRNDYVQIVIPKYVTNFFTLIQYILFLENNNLLVNSDVIKNNIKFLPRNYKLNDNTQIIVQNENEYRKKCYAKYLTDNNLSGTINMVPVK